MTQYVKKSVSTTDVTIVADKAAICCAIDFRPFYMIEGQGFCGLIQSIIDLVSVKGRLDAEKLLPSADTVKNHLMAIDQKIRVNLTEKLSKIKFINCTTDHWVDKYSGQSYQSMTIHYFDPMDDKLHARVIGTFPVDDKTSASIASGFKEKLDEFKIESKVKIVVTDNASAMKSTFKNDFRDVDWIGCSAHNISLVHQYCYGKDKGEGETNTDPFPSITKLIKSSKSIVEYMKKSGNNRFLDQRLKQSVDTRWDSYVDMLQSVLDNIEGLSEISSVKVHMDEIHIGLLKELTALLERVRFIRLQLSSESKPTFHYVAVSYASIAKLMEKAQTDHLAIKAFKVRFLSCLKSKYHVTPLNLVATFLSPAYRSFKFHDKELVERSISVLKYHMDIIDESDDEELTIDQNSIENADGNEQSLFADYIEKPTAPNDIETEIERYKAQSLSSAEIKMNPLDFWSANREHFPKLYKIASWLLAAPATNITSERSFSAVGNVITPHRNSLSPEIVDMLVFVRYNKDLV